MQGIPRGRLMGLHGRMGTLATHGPTVPQEGEETLPMGKGGEGGKPVIINWCAEFVISAHKDFLDFP